jgi:hypothetical protein
LLPLLRYSPDLSPIKLCWSKLKTPLRPAEPRSIDATEEQIGPTLDTITPRMPRAGFAIVGILRQTGPKIVPKLSSKYRAGAVRLGTAVVILPHVVRCAEGIAGGGWANS